MRSFNAAALVLAALALACGPKDPTNPAGTVINIDASPATVNVGNGAYSKITVTGQSSNIALQEGVTVSFETDVGSFSADDESTQTNDVTVAGGKAVIKLYAPAEPPAVCHEKYPCAATVTAKFIDAYSNTFTKTIKVTFQTATLVTHINFNCTSKNIGALWDGIGDIGVKCTAVAEDENNEVVQGAHVKFLTEAGELAPETDSGDAGTFIYNPRAGGRQPFDTTPFSGEPSWTDPSKIEGGGSVNPRNPRDGLVTLVAYVEGDPAIASTQSTPFVDRDDDNQHQSGEDMPPGVTSYEATQSSTSFVWRQIKMLWTARTSADMPQGTHVSGDTSTPMQRGDVRIFTWTIVDKNLNVIAANAESDLITFENDAQSGVDVNPSGLAVAHSMGLDVDDNFVLRNPTSAATYQLDRTYKVTVTNNRPSTDTNGEELLNITPEVEHNLVTDDSGVAGDDVTEGLPGIQLKME